MKTRCREVSALVCVQYRYDGYARYVIRRKTQKMGHARAGNFFRGVGHQLEKKEKKEGKEKEKKERRKEEEKGKKRRKVQLIIYDDISTGGCLSGERD
jgi:RNA-splicing ligase RtcB